MYLFTKKEFVLFKLTVSFLIILNTLTAKADNESTKLKMEVKFVTLTEYGLKTFVPKNIDSLKIDEYFKNNHQFENYGMNLKELPSQAQLISDEPDSDIKKELINLKQKGVINISVELFAGLTGVSKVVGSIPYLTDNIDGKVISEIEQICTINLSIDMKETFPKLYSRYLEIERFEGNKHITQNLDRFFKEPLRLEHKVVTDYGDFENYDSKVMSSKHICYDSIKGSENFFFDTELVNSLQRIASWISGQKTRTNRWLSEIGY